MTSTPTTPGAQVVSSSSAVCLSTECAEVGKPAEVSGVFDCSATNGRPAREASYCMRCAVALGDVGYFTPTDGTVLPSLIVWISENEPRVLAED